MAAWWRSYITQRSRQLGLDPRAVLAIAAQEGLGGGVGDRGTSFGPFQLHVGGALPAGKGRAWAESPAGIDYALGQIAQVARGLRGRAAVEAISRRFERPANPSAEIAGALRSYGLGGTAVADVLPGAGAAGPSPTAAPDLSRVRMGLLQSLIAASQATSMHQEPNYAPVFSGLKALRQGATVGFLVPPGSRGLDRGVPSTGGTLSFLEPFGQRYGLKITSTNTGKHVEGSYHYQNRAVDFSGSPAHMSALMDYALSHPKQFTEAFYDPAGAYVKNGKVYRGSIGGHSNHVHLAR